MGTRRSRMRRRSSGKRIVLTERDLAIFAALARYRYLRSTYLHVFAGGASQTRFKERLGDLFHEGYLDRPEAQWHFADARHAPAVYELGSGAQRILVERGAEATPQTFLGRHGHRQFQHSLMICEIMASIELAARGLSGLRFIPWPEILVKAPTSTRGSKMPFRLSASQGFVIPDGVFGIEYQLEGRKAYRFFALEADRGTMPIARASATQTHLLGKFAMYETVIARQLYKSHWGIPNLLVLTVTVSPERLASILCKLSPTGGSPVYLFQAASARTLTAPMPGLLFEAWKRPGLSPFWISKSE